MLNRNNWLKISAQTHAGQVLIPQYVVERCYFLRMLCNSTFRNTWLKPLPTRHQKRRSYTPYGDCAKNFQPPVEENDVSIMHRNLHLERVFQPAGMTGEIISAYRNPIMEQNLRILKRQEIQPLIAVSRKV